MGVTIDDAIRLRVHVVQSFFNNDVDHAERQGAICAGFGGNMNVCCFRGAGAGRINDDNF